MSAPHLNRRLALEAPVRAPDGAGGFSESWAVLGEVWAEVSARTGRERAVAGGPVSAVGYRIVVRSAPVGAASRPLPEQRFREGARLFIIQAVADRDPVGRYLTCFADEEVAA
ncbi:MAG: head-tail adaptor [Paracoccaceae bacterium]|jgi:head-tail adaptor